MSKPATPNASLLILVFKGLSAWAVKAGYARARSLIGQILSDSDLSVGRWGGRLVEFEGDRLTACFLNLPHSGVVNGLRSGTELIESIRGRLKDVPNVTPLIALVALHLGDSKIRKDFSNLGPLTRRTGVGAEKALQKLRSGSPLVLNRAAAEAGGFKVKSKPHGSLKGMEFLVEVAGPKTPPRKGPALPLAEALQEPWLEPVLLAEPTRFSIVALRLRNPRAKERSGLGKDPYSFARETAAFMGGEILKAPKDFFLAQFTGLSGPDDVAQRAVRFACWVLGDVRARYTRKGLRSGVGAGVASGEAPFGKIRKRSGDTFKKVLNRSRSLAIPGPSLGPRIDSATLEQVRGRFVEAGTKAAKIKGVELLGPDTTWSYETAFRAPGGFAEVAAGDNLRKFREQLRKSAKDGKFRLVRAEAETEATRFLGAAGLMEAARKLGWRVMASRCSEASVWRSFGPWKDVLGELAGFDGSDAPEAVRDRLQAMLEKTQRTRDEVVLRSLLALFGVLPESKPMEHMGPSLHRRLIEKGAFLLLSKAVTNRPTLIAILEAHLADGSSIEFLQRLREPLADKPVVLLVVHSPEYKLRKADLEMKLAPTKGDQDLAMTQEFLGTKDLPREIRSLVHGLEGDPRWILDTLDMLRLKGKLRFSKGKWRLSSDALPKSHSRKAAALACLKALPSDQQKAATIAGILGPDFDGRVFNALWGGEALRLLIDLEGAGRISSTSDLGYGRWTFGSGESADAAASLVASGPRSALHAQAATALTSLFENRIAEVEHLIGLHWKASGNRSAFAKLQVRAGRRAKALGFPAEAEACYREVLGLPGPNDLAKASIFLEEAEVLSELGRDAEAVALLESILKSKVMRVPRKKKPPQGI